MSEADPFGLASAWNARLCQDVREKDLKRLGRDLRRTPHRTPGPKDEDPVLVATMCRNAGALEMLLRAGFDPNFADEAGETALTWCQDVDILKLLLKYGADPLRERVPNGPSSLHRMAEEGQLEMVQLIVESVPEAARAELLNRPYLGGDTPLMSAALGRSLEVMAYLIEYGAEVNFISEEYLGVTALCRAVDARWLEGVHFLLERGADPSLKIGLHDSAFLRALTIDFPEACALFRAPDP